MKHNLNKSYLLGLSLLSALLVIWFINVTSGAWAATEIGRSVLDTEHRTRLHSLYLWSGTGTELTWAWMRVFTGGKTLNVLNWFMVWWWTASGSLLVVGWWSGNVISWKNVGIGWWLSNKVLADDSVIGGGRGNTVNWIGGTIAWWQGNTAGMSGTVVWWQGNTASNWWVVLWGQGNNSNWDGSLALWNGSNWGVWSFAWNWTASSSSAYISSVSWVWIWDSSIRSLSGVYLYVDWVVKVDNSNLTTEWEVVLDDKCIRWYDGTHFRTFGRAAWDEDTHCWWRDGICEWGTISFCFSEPLCGRSSAPYRSMKTTDML